MPFDKAMINEHVFLLRTNEKAKQEYLFHFLYSTIGQSLLKANITGQAQGGLNSTNLNNIKIPLPSITVQEKIITEIEAIEKKEKAGREKVESLRDGKMKLVIETLETSYPVKKLGDLSHLITKGSSPKWQGINYTKNEEVLFVTSENVREGYLDFTKRKYLEKSLTRSKSVQFLKKMMSL